MNEDFVVGGVVVFNVVVVEVFVVVVNAGVI